VLPSLRFRMIQPPVAPVGGLAAGEDQLVYVGAMRGRPSVDMVDLALVAGYVATARIFCYIEPKHIAVQCVSVIHALPAITLRATTVINRADRAALVNLWGDAGTWVADTWSGLNNTHLNGQLR
jgi:hypothetical protein